MRYMILIAGPEIDRCEGAEQPEADEIVASYHKYTEDLKKAGVLLGGEALHESNRGTRVSVESGKRSVTDGPFSESKEVIGGFYLIDVKSKEEALEWAARCPAAWHPGPSYAEVREVMEFPS